MKGKRGWTLIGSMFLVLIFAATVIGAPVGEPIRVGAMGPFSGPSASWGLAFKRSGEMWADEINAEGGLLVEGVRYPIKLYSEDTRFDAALTKTVAERLVYEYKVRYILGPATTMETEILQPISEPNKVVFYSGSVTVSLYGPKHPYTIMALPLSPVFITDILQYLMDKRGAKSYYSLAVNNKTGVTIQNMDVAAARKLGMKVLAPDANFEKETTDFYPVMTKVKAANPDVVAIEGAGAEHVALCAKAAGELGLKGIILAPQACDIETVVSVAGKHAEGVMWIGGKPNPTAKMNKFIQDYKAKYGVWNDEAGQKIVDAWMIGATIQAAGKAALTDNDAWVRAMPKVAWPNPYIEKNPIIRYVGKDLLGKECLVGIPACLVEVRQGKDVEVMWIQPK